MKVASNMARRALLILGLTFSYQISAESVADIMEKVDYLARKSVSTQVARVKLTTCKYRVDKNKIRCAEKPRIVLLENAKKLGGVESVQDRSLAIVLEPISDKGVGLLTYEYQERGRDNDNWIYLTEFGKVNRIIVSPDEPGSVFGSEFSLENTENPEARKIYEFAYEIVEESTYQGRPVWVVRLTPTKEKAVKTRYTKLLLWIDKERYIALKEDYYRNDVLHKRRLQEKVNKVDGIWVAQKVTMNNISSKRITLMDKSLIAFNVELDDEFLTQRPLTDFAFRERNLRKLRGHLRKATADSR
jgi:hypothetical protein